jgi:hypothetical protein
MTARVRSVPDALSARSTMCGSGLARSTAAEQITVPITSRAPMASSIRSISSSLALLASTTCSPRPTVAVSRSGAPGSGRILERLPPGGDVQVIGVEQRAVYVEDHPTPAGLAGRSPDL